MKAVEYINELIKERDELKELCKKHVDTIRTKEKELIKLNNEISRKNKAFKNSESGSETNVVNTQNNHELEILKDDFNALEMKYNNLQSEYDTVVNENNELNRFVNDNKIVKDNFDKLTKDYETLQSKYDKVVNENLELNNFFEEFDVLTKDYETLQSNYETLQSKYDTVVSENLELKSIFEYIENISDSDEQ
jgi:uncharacterized protein (DUF3084 family)